MGTDLFAADSLGGYPELEGIHSRAINRVLSPVFHRFGIHLLGSLNDGAGRHYQRPESI